MGEGGIDRIAGGVESARVLAPPACVVRTVAADVDRAPLAVVLAQVHKSLPARTVQDHLEEALGLGHHSLIC